MRRLGTQCFFSLLLCLILVSCYGSGSQDTGMEEAYRFPEDFSWGVALSAYQTEGNSPNDFDRWLRNGHSQVRNGDACNSYELFDLDNELARAMGVNSLRTGIEWARVEPEKDVFDEKEISHYREVLESIRSRGMKPFVTLHHFTNPLWIADHRGWLNPDVVTEFADYARRMAQTYGDIVDEWITINEPVIYATGTYWTKMFPGGSLLNMDKMKRALINMIYAHAAAYDAIRKADVWDADQDGSPCRISFVKALCPNDPADPASPDDVKAAERYDSFYNRQIYDALVYGRLGPWLEEQARAADARAAGYGTRPELAGRVDYIGINYYGPWHIKSLPLVLPPLNAFPCMSILGAVCFPEGRPDVVVGDNGNEVEPSGLLRVIWDYASYGVPMIITENGIATLDQRMRSWYLVQHVDQIQEALQRGYPVEGYLHWSLLDNFEWLDGYSMKFGLYRVDFDSFERIATESVEAYREIIRAGRVTQEIKGKYDWP